MNFYMLEGQIISVLGCLAFVILVVYLLLAFAQGIIEYACKVFGIYKEVMYFMINRKRIRKIVSEQKDMLV